MIRQAVVSDISGIEAFLYQHAETSMFLLNNLLTHGVEGATHAHATTFWIQTLEDRIAGVFGLANNGFAIAQAPSAAQSDWAAWARLLQGRQIHGMTGIPAQVDAAFAALGLSDATFLVNLDDPLYALDHDKLPEWDVTMRLAEPDDMEMLTEWFMHFAIDTEMSASQEQAEATGRARAAGAIADPDVMLMIHDGHAVAMAGINARVPDMVQVGGVFTPRTSRGQGLARRAVVGLLNAQTDVARSILFAADASAARAYEAIGYRLIGTYRVAMLKEPHLIGATP